MSLRNLFVVFSSAVLVMRRRGVCFRGVVTASTESFSRFHQFSFLTTIRVTCHLTNIRPNNSSVTTLLACGHVVVVALPVPASSFYLVKVDE
jgi:hypothetical protein